MSVRREYVDFRIIDEPWNRYKLADGTLLKTRIVMTDVRVIVSQKNEKSYSANFKNCASHVIPFKNFLEPTNSAYSEDVLKSPQNLVDIGFRRESEKMNHYELDDGSSIKAKLNITTIMKSKLPQKDGAPYYFISAPGLWWEARKPEVSK